MTSVVDLRCEYRTNPLGIDVVAPRFSWQLESERAGAAQPHTVSWRRAASSSCLPAPPISGTAGAWTRTSRCMSSTTAQPSRRANVYTGRSRSGTRPATRSAANRPGSKWGCWRRTTGRPSGSAPTLVGGRALQRARALSAQALLAARRTSSRPGCTSRPWVSTNVRSTARSSATMSSPPAGPTMPSASSTRSTMSPICWPTARTSSARCWATAGRPAMWAWANARTTFDSPSFWPNWRSRWPMEAVVLVCFRRQLAPSVRSAAGERHAHGRSLRCTPGDARLGQARLRRQRLADGQSLRPSADKTGGHQRPQCAPHRGIVAHR